MSPFNMFAPPLPPDQPEHPEGHVSVENVNGSCVVKIFESARRERLVIHIFMDWQTAAILARRINALAADLEPLPEWPKEI